MSETPAPPPPKLEDMMTFPAVFVFRALGSAEEDFAARCAAAVTGALGRLPEAVETRESSGGRYLSVRIGATVLDPAEVYAAYAALREVPGLRMVL